MFNLKQNKIDVKNKNVKDIILPDHTKSEISYLQYYKNTHLNINFLDMQISKKKRS